MLGLTVLGLVGLGARAEAQHETGWELHVPDHLELPSGTSGTLALSIAIDRGLTISKDGGLILDLAPEGALTVKRRRLGRADAVDPDAEAPRFQIPVHGEGSGDFALKVHVRFWLCGDKVCRPIDARRTIAVTVVPPPSPAAPPDAGVDGPPALDAGRHRAR